MRIVTLLNEKGGVGKTTVAFHIAAGLAVAGYRVLAVDADAQGSLTEALGFDQSSDLYDLIVRNRPFKDVLQFVDPETYGSPTRKVTGQLFLLSSNVETQSIATNSKDALAFVRRFSELGDAVDYVVVDTSPTPSLLHGAIYLATDAILYPTKCEYLSFRGLQNSFMHREENERYRSQFNFAPITNLGIIPNMYRHKTLEHQENLKELKDVYGDLVWNPIPQSTIWTECSRVHRTVWNYAPQSSATTHGWKLLKRFLEAIKHVKPTKS
jgi:chromosome partitioning protein